MNFPMKPLFSILGLTVCLALGGCVPKIYVIDRQTVLEEEAAGEWPQFEKDFLKSSEAMGPSPLFRVPESSHRQKIYNVLNGELAYQTTETAKTPPKPGSKP